MKMKLILEIDGRQYDLENNHIQFRIYGPDDKDDRYMLALSDKATGIDEMGFAIAERESAKISV